MSGQRRARAPMRTWADAMSDQTNDRSMETPPPLLDGRYELLRELGRGSTAAVWEARDRTSAEMVAVKLLHPHLVPSPAARARFLREVRTARGLRHAHSVEVRSHRETED